jgi:hypothetical protein
VAPPGRCIIAIACWVLLPWRATLAGGSLVAGFSEGVAFLLALPALGATSGAGGPTVATGSGSFAVVFCIGSSDFAPAC